MQLNLMRYILFAGFFVLLSFSYEISKEAATVTVTQIPTKISTVQPSKTPSITTNPPTTKPTLIPTNNDDTYTQSLSTANENFNSGLNNATSAIDSTEAWLSNLIDEVNQFFNELGYYVGYGTIITALIAGFCPWAQVFPFYSTS